MDGEVPVSAAWRCSTACGWRPTRRTPLRRSPFTIQGHAISTALKLLALGETPFLVADVGTGKSTMGLYLAAALSPG